MRRLTTLVAATVAALAAAAAPSASPLAAQAKPPQRPRLAADADTNDADAYFEYGNLRETSWKKAQDAFYWAYRLDPRNPNFLLAQYQALWFKQSPEWRYAYVEGAEYALKSKEAKQLDSLEDRVAMRDPFVHYAGCTVPSWIDEVDDPVASGSIYFDGACYGKAAEQWGKALAKRPALVGLRVRRASALHYSGSNGIALQELQAAIDTLRGRDAKQLGKGRLYDSKEWLEYKIGLIQMQEENFDAARAAFGRALSENLALYQAHARLGDLDMLQNDVEGAIAEYDQAVQLKGADDPVLHDTYGVALLRANQARYADAEAQFRKAIELAPEYAIPYYNLAVALAKQGRKDDAVTQFRAFVARAPRNNVRLIDAANKSITALQGAVAAGAPK